MFFVQLAETAAEAERLRAAIAARYGLAPHDAADHPLFLVGTVGELRERLAERVARLDLGHGVLQLRDDGGSRAGRSRGVLRPALTRRAT